MEPAAISTKIQSAATEWQRPSPVETNTPTAAQRDFAATLRLGRSADPFVAPPKPERKGRDLTSRDQKASDEFTLLKASLRPAADATPTTVDQSQQYVDGAIAAYERHWTP